MRIGLVIGMLARGGAELQLITLARGLAARGHDVRVLAYDGASEFDDDVRSVGAEVETATARTRPEKRRVVRHWLRRSQCDVVHAFMNLASSLTILARFPARRPAIVATDYSTATYQRHDLLLRTALASFVLAQRVVTESELNRENLERLVPWLRGKTVVIRNGLDPERFAPAERDRPADDVFRFCVVGTVHAVKNPSGVVDAIVELVRRGHHGFHVDWYGRMGGEPNGHEGERARAYAISSGVARFITFHGASSRVERAYQGADALLHAALSEGFPNAVAEGMACGLPVALSRISDLPLVVAEARNGFTFDERDPAAIADAMEQMMRVPPAERRAMGRRSRDVALKWFSIDRFLDEHESLYRALVGSRS